MGLVFGLFFHWLGGLASASFYIPYRRVQRWSWETYWLVGGFFSWLIAPLILASILVPDTIGVIRSAPASSLAWAYFWGTMWGLGGLTFGLTMRYLGIALGMAIALGYCAAFGTLMPPIFDGTITTLVVQTPGQFILFGVLVCLTGIGISGAAGMSKEREMPEEEKKAAIKEFNFPKGLMVATFSGILSASMAYGMAAGKPIAEIALTNLTASGKSDLWQNLPILVVVLWGGFTTNFIWCMFLNFKNRSGHEYFSPMTKATESEESKRVPMLNNYVFSALAGVTWYMQFFFYSMGETRMGKYSFSSWTLHMASIIIFSTLWGIFLKEWHGTSKRTKVLVAVGLAILILSTLVVGYGNYLNTLPQYAVEVAVN
ncbi:MAG: L-rhamnose/proton symporter RhaT [Candidatus Hydrogenedens sp.]|jgi:L-rhamnose-H+ transport protein|nr:L-rhamnose/proton symporter RhaT [Candidatus Hydrogenedens sp.]